MFTDILYPSLIGAACLLLVIVVHLLTRPKPSRADITVPGAQSRLSIDEAQPTVFDLEQWHQRHEETLLSFVEVHDQVVHGDDSAKVSEDFEAAVNSHPAPEMRAELAALRTAAEAVAAARERNDAVAFTRHRDVYDRYRNAWLERLWQFPVDRERVESVRAGVNDGMDS